MFVALLPTTFVLALILCVDQLDLIDNAKVKCLGNDLYEKREGDMNLSVLHSSSTRYSRNISAHLIYAVIGECNNVICS